MAVPRTKFEETLEKFVLPNSCMGCATCIVTCPFDCLEYVGEKPRLGKECKSCGICARTCPRFQISKPALEQLLFDRARKIDEEFGVYRRVIIAQAIDENILRICQDGGVVTALLFSSLENKVIDGAAICNVSSREPLKPIPQLATTKEGIIECAGTRYTYSPNMFAFDEGVKQNKKSLAFVGTPCQIEAMRRIQALPLRKYSAALGLTIGLFCSKCFTYDGLVRKLFQEEMKIDLYDIKKVNIKGKMLVVLKSGGSKVVSLKEAKKYASNCFMACADFSAELADISVGGLGLNGWNLTLLRTRKGEEILRKAEMAGAIRTKTLGREDDYILDMLAKLSRRKRENAASLIY